MVEQGPGQAEKKAAEALLAGLRRVARRVEAGDAARAERRALAGEAREAGVTWAEIARAGGWGTLQAAQREVTRERREEPR